LDRNPETPLQILKMLFGQDNDGRYVIRAFMPLTLAPADPSDPTFFLVKDDMLIVQPSTITTILSALGQSIVPIVAAIPGEGVMRCLGTGFFVSATGLLITAAHVLMDPIERGYGGVREVAGHGWDFTGLNLGVMVPTNPVFQRKGWVFRKIDWGTLLATSTDHPLPFRPKELRLTSDTAICKVEAPLADLPYQPLAIVQPGIRGVGLGVGKGAIAIGYGAMNDVDLEEEAGVVSGDFSFGLYVAVGNILERFPNNGTNKQVMAPGPCFSASLKLPAGMSRSPIFDDERIYVHGVVSMGLQGESGPDDLGYGSMLAPLMSMPIPFMGEKSLAKLISEGNEGMAKLNIAGG
jgi:hypothetical protein